MDSSVFGKIIEVLMKYHKDNWVCLYSTRVESIPYSKFIEEYHPIPQAIIKTIPIKYTFQGKEYIGVV